MTENELTFSTAGDLFQHWANTGYPDYVTGVWSTDGGTDNLTIGVLENEAGETGKQEILELVENDATVSFAYQTYSRNYLLQLQEELLPYFKQEGLGMTFTGLYDTDNCIEVGILQDKANDETTLNFIAELQNTYGDAISVVYTDAIVLQTSEEIGLSAPLSPSKPGDRTVSPLLLFGLVGIPLLVFWIYFILRKRFIPVMQTNAGAVVTKGKALSTREVKEMVKESSFSVPNELEERIFEAIEVQKGNR